MSSDESWRPHPVYGNLTLDEHEQFAREELERLKKIEDPYDDDISEIEWFERFLHYIANIRAAERQLKK